MVSISKIISNQFIVNKIWS